MTWTVEKIERELLLADIGSIVRPAQTIVEAIERTDRMLGAEWIASQSVHKGLASAMRIVGMGLRLQTIEGLRRSEELLHKLCQYDSSADAELTGIYLLRSGAPNVVVELFPTVGAREADFRVRRGIEEWTTVEVTQATESRERSTRSCWTFASSKLSSKCALAHNGIFGRAGDKQRLGARIGIESAHNDFAERSPYFL
jgi:hypothetical protein